MGNLRIEKEPIKSERRKYLNSILIIFPYKINNTWFFDDPNYHLVREPFVFGMPEMIDKLVSDIPNSNMGFRLLFSAKPFPTYQAEIDLLRREYEGNWYFWKDKNLEGWLCPALLLYFAEPPEKIYCRAEAA
jgi:hypothetical protein